jgi:signal transduction histidine kinase
MEHSRGADGAPQRTEATMSMRQARAPATPPRTIVRILGEAGATLASFAGVFFPWGFGGLRVASPLAVALLVTAVAVMLLRRRAPRIAVGATVALTVGAILIGGALASQLITVLVTVFTLGKHTNRRSTIVAAVATILAIWSASMIILGPVITDLRAALLIVASVGFAAAAGDSSRSRRAYIDEITDRARRAEETKEAEARRRVADERVAIARDLHDLVAHQIAVVSLNAGVASRALRDRPADAERALGTIHSAAQTVLDEISGLLTILRASDDGAVASRLAPSPGLIQLPALVAEFESSGLTVHRRTEGEPREIPAAVDAVAYRALQEALTNALKHSGGEGNHPASALVHLEYRTDAIVLTVTNPVAPAKPGAPDSSRGGHGLNGVRERVASVRGRVDAGPGPGPVYRFTALLPLPDASEGHSPASANAALSPTYLSAADAHAGPQITKKTLL